MSWLQLLNGGIALVPELGRGIMEKLSLRLQPGAGSLVWIGPDERVE